jgi:hypothetical protein
VRFFAIQKHKDTLELYKEEMKGANRFSRLTPTGADDKQTAKSGFITGKKELDGCGSITRKASFRP